MIGRMINYKGFGRKRFEPYDVSIMVFAWRQRQKLQQSVVRAAGVLP
jgi:hypothetical protein